MFRVERRRVASCIAVLIGVGCSTHTPDLAGQGGDLEWTIRAESEVATPDEPAVIVITVENTGSDRIEWGRGSSSCQIDLVVRVADSDWPAVVDRPCTLDMAPQGLEPGESRTERFPWDGRIRRASPPSIERLPPGSYPVRGAAGEVAKSEAVSIQVESGS